MSELQSKLVRKIVDTDINNRFFGAVLAKGKTYYLEKRVKEIYSPRYEELIARVEGTSDYYVHMSIDKNNIHYDCTCPFQYNCKHIVSVLHEIRNNPIKYDEATSLIEPVRGNNNPRLDEIIVFLYRLIGPNKVISGYVEGEFNIYFNRLLRGIKEIIKSDEDKYLIGKYINDCLSFAISCTYHNTTYKIKFERDIYPLINEVLMLDENKESNLVSGIIENTNDENITVLIEALKEFSKVNKITYTYNKLLNGVFGYASINQTVDLNNLIELKAKSLYELDKEAFLKYANTYSYVEEIRYLLFKVYFDNEKYNEVISLYEKYDIYFNVQNYELYLKSLIRLGYDYKDSVIESFENNPSYELYEVIKRCDLLNDNDLKNCILNISSSQKDFSGKAKIIAELGDIKDVFKIIISITNTKERLDAILENIDNIKGINDLELIKVLEEDIVLSYEKNSNFKLITKYLDIFYNLKLGNMYLHNLLLYINKKYGVTVFEQPLYMRYVSRAKEYNYV